MGPNWSISYSSIFSASIGITNSVKGGTGSAISVYSSSLQSTVEFLWFHTTDSNRMYYIIAVGK